MCRACCVLSFVHYPAAFLPTLEKCGKSCQLLLGEDDVNFIQMPVNTDGACVSARFFKVCHRARRSSYRGLCPAEQAQHARVSTHDVHLQLSPQHSCRRPRPQPYLCAPGKLGDELSMEEQLFIRNGTKQRNPRHTNLSRSCTHTRCMQAMSCLCIYAHLCGRQRCRVASFAALLRLQDVLFQADTYSISSKHFNLIAFGVELGLLMRVLRGAGMHDSLDSLEVKLTQKATAGSSPAETRPFLTFTARVRARLVYLGTNILEGAGCRWLPQCSAASLHEVFASYDCNTLGRFMASIHPPPPFESLVHQRAHKLAQWGVPPHFCCTGPKHQHRSGSAHLKALCRA